MPLQTYANYFGAPQQADPINALTAASQIKQGASANAISRETWSTEQKIAIQGMMQQYLGSMNLDDPKAFAQQVAASGPQIAKDIYSIFGGAALPAVAMIKGITEDAQTPEGLPKVMNLAKTYRDAIMSPSEQVNYLKGVRDLNTPQKWEPTTEEGAIRLKQAGQTGQGWKPQTMEEAMTVRKAGSVPRSPYYQYAGMDEEGNPIAFNARTGQFEGRTVPGGTINPKPTNMPIGEQQAAEQFNMLSKMTGLAGQLYKDEWVGPAYGRVQKKGSEYVNIPQDQARFYVAVDSMSNILIYLRSGKQINEAEYERMKKEMPRAEYPPAKFKAGYNNFIDQLTDILKVKGPAMKRRGINPDDILNAISPKMNPEAETPQSAKAPATADEYLKSLGEK